MYTSIQQIRVFVILDKKLSFFCIFLRKNLVNSKKKQYLCTRFRKESIDLTQNLTRRDACIDEERRKCESL